MASWRYGGGSSPRWVAARNGSLPARAFVGGKDHDGVLYVARARHSGVWVPGKLNPSHGKCYIPFGGEEKAFSEYEVLCGSNMRWISSSGGTVPPRCVPASDPQEGEVTYIGRVHHDGISTVGKVHPSHGVCYIPYDGKEVAHRSYEILIA